ncbi:gp53-like domain-containing protein [Sporomusa sp.]|uniref:gp53-like domain-containing protein n=1 Tax=Sporomusa sp. TaxID=2078658 RepID=UPI002D0FA4D2|nr:hypothetical protein [Sporomusa sp.]HWR06293.1 hypothetical protein [Sporomusa sp.]
MAHDPNFPANESFLADFPPAMRAEILSIINDGIVKALSLQGLTPGNTGGKIPISNGTLCTGLNAEKLGGFLSSAFALAAHVHAVATGSSNGFMSNTDFLKLAGIAAGAQVNQNAWSNILIGATTIQADSATDTLEFIQGANITITADPTNDRITIAVSGKVPTAGAADTATTASACSGLSATATKLATPRTITLSGDVTGSVSFDGSGNVTITTVVVDDSHNHTIANIDGLQAALDAKLASTGTAANASKVGGYAPAIGAYPDTAVNPNTVVVRDSNGYISANYLRMVNPATNATAFTGYMGRTGDGFLYEKSIANVKAELGVSSGYDAAHSLTANGYQKFSNGLIIQWGVSNRELALGIAGVFVIFPIAFPNLCFNVQVSLSGEGHVHGYAPRADAVTKTGFLYREDYWTSNYNPLENHYWLAIGY